MQWKNTYHNIKYWKSKRMNICCNCINGRAMKKTTSWNSFQGLLRNNSMPESNHVVQKHAVPPASPSSAEDAIQNTLEALDMESPEKLPMLSGKQKSKSSLLADTSLSNSLKEKQTSKNSKKIENHTDEGKLNLTKNTGTITDMSNKIQDLEIQFAKDAENLSKDITGYLEEYSEVISEEENQELSVPPSDDNPAGDADKKGWLTTEEMLLGLRSINSQLTAPKEEYLCRIIEMTGYSIEDGADFQLFAILAALSNRITSLDDWMKNIVDRFDYQLLDMKTFKCKTLWECNVDPDTHKISLDQLCVDLKAGGVSLSHEEEVRSKLQHLNALDLLDFLTYVPLFIMVHNSVVDNPLDSTWGS
ncbi:Hypothetical predicted protein [Octopus vulgaris]|uniref:Uncharacterized protein n=1 Tax=Octopus vulgaris TaxID=6645 RepID=A0AA36FIZ1_OCTVU|nr:Hypothetical predicted protein [Octopus vulgaris]